MKFRGGGSGIIVGAPPVTNNGIRTPGQIFSDLQVAIQVHQYGVAASDFVDLLKRVIP